MARSGILHLASALGALGIVLVATNFGCSSNAACDSAKCAAGNKCLAGFVSADAEQKGTDVQTTCKLPCKQQSDCPFNYHCTGVGGSEPYCVADRAPGGKPYTKKSTGQWGASCDPTKGLENNPGCDSAQNFWCYAASPTDGAAFCTQYQCKDDGDCAGGYTCTTINTAPNASTANRTFGETTTVCLPRVWNGSTNTYCASCKSDVDCPLNEGRAQHCVAIGDGNESVCAVECKTNSNCTKDAACADTGGGYAVCVPRANTCKGDGNYCAPCHSDKDCKNGFCIGADYSTERFCTQKSTTACTSNVSGNTRTITSQDCPKTPVTGDCFDSARNGKATGSQVGDQCYGTWNFNGTPIPGCWSSAK